MSDIAKAAQKFPAMMALHAFDIWLQALACGDVEEVLWQQQRLNYPSMVPGVTPLFGHHPSDER